MLSDIKTCVALEVLMRYLQDNSASPLRQRFVESASPWAGYIWYELEYYVRPYISITFGGVPCRGEDEGMSSLLQHGPFYQALMEELRRVAEQDFSDTKAMRNALQRHRVKLCEDIEYSPHDTLIDAMTAIIVAQSFLGADQEAAPALDSFSKIFDVLDELEKEPGSFWKALLQRWLIDAPVVEVIMVPDVHLGGKIETQILEMQQKKRAELGKKGVARLAADIARATEANKVNLSLDVIKKMPPVPAMDRVPLLPFQTQRIAINDKERPFTMAQIVQTDTGFVHIQLGLPIATLPDSLRPYLFLFQALVFESSVRVPKGEFFSWMKEESKSSNGILDYRDVTKGLARDLVLHSATCRNIMAS
jgi:Zn-dependent M16 (insulinase) family peptidase